MVRDEVNLLVGLTDAVGTLSHIDRLSGDESIRSHRSDLDGLLDVIHIMSTDALARLRTTQALEAQQ